MLFHFLTGKEKKIREQWFVFTMLSLFLGFCTNAIQLTPLLPASLFVFLFLTFFQLLFFWAFYRCSYKAMGTRLLSFFMVLQVTGFLLIFDPLNVERLHSSIFATLQAIVGYFIMLIQLVLSWKMRATNRRIRHQVAVFCKIPASLE